MRNATQLYEKFEKVFNTTGEKLYFSPGRVNLIGEHTDYNGGHVFPVAISLGTYAVVKKSEDKFVRAYSENFSEMGVSEFELSDLQYNEKNQWVNYVKGMLFYIEEVNGTLPFGFDVYIYGTIPNGASLSSSASLEILIGIIANDLYGLDLSPLDLTKLGMRVENDYFNLQSGIMDQFIIAHGEKDHGLLLNTHDLSFEQIPLNFADYKLVIMNSLKRRELVDSAYNERQEQCEMAVKMLQQVVSISNLSELTESEFEQYKYAITDPVVTRRAKHVVYENRRTLQAVEALKEEQYEVFGNLMNDSHLSLHEDYEVTVPETDLLAREAWEQEGVLGARMTGGGFGGCCIAIVEQDAVDSVCQKIKESFERSFGYEPEFYIVDTEDGARKISEL